MVKAVFTTKVNPAYDDLPEFRYHFPRMYLNQVEQALGDWIVYYEPRRHDADPSGREGRQVYFAAARVTSLDEDPDRKNHYYAYVSDFLPFGRLVPFKEGAHYYERKLQKPDGTTNKGAFRRAVRLMSDDEYELIVRAGYAPLVGSQISESLRDVGRLYEDAAEFDRPIREQLNKRPFRDAAFASVVKKAYNATCALTGIHLIDGRGRAETDAAHIRPVGEGHKGPDSVRNGVALCKTVHWMFDRGLISLTDEYEIILSESYVPESIQRVLNPDRRMRIPDDPHLRPHPRFIKYHRKYIFQS